MVGTLSLHPPPRVLGEIPDEDRLQHADKGLHLTFPPPAPRAEDQRDPDPDHRGSGASDQQFPDPAEGIMDNMD